MFSSLSKPLFPVESEAMDFTVIIVYIWGTARPGIELSTSCTRTTLQLSYRDGWPDGK